MADLEDFASFEVFGLPNFLKTKFLKNNLPKTMFSNCYIDIFILDLSITSLSLKKAKIEKNLAKLKCFETKFKALWWEIIWIEVP